LNWARTACGRKQLPWPPLQFLNYSKAGSTGTRHILSG
jgi:hypothetical protein